jgi:hypothetical protein
MRTDHALLDENLFGERDNAALPLLVKNTFHRKRAMHAAVKAKRHREVLTLIASPRDRLALHAILRKGTRGRHDEEQEGK